MHTHTDKSNNNNKKTDQNVIINIDLKWEHIYCLNSLWNAIKTHDYSSLGFLCCLKRVFLELWRDREVKLILSKGTQTFQCLSRKIFLTLVFCTKSLFISLKLCSLHQFFKILSLSMKKRIQIVWVNALLADWIKVTLEFLKLVTQSWFPTLVYNFYTLSNTKPSTNIRMVATLLIVSIGT